MQQHIAINVNNFVKQYQLSNIMLMQHAIVYMEITSNNNVFMQPIVICKDREYKGD